jgi:mannose-6-phosphate isomerase-like protein (cupin superfamily)
MSNLLALIADLYDRTPEFGDGMLAGASAELRGLGNQPPSGDAPATLPVCLVLPQGLAAAGNGPLAGIGAAFAALEPRLRWRQNPAYTVATMGLAFVANYGYAEFVGIDRPWQSGRTLVGCLLLGPDTHYPTHEHPAAEVYHVISGTAVWWQGSGPVASRPPGSTIHHVPHVPHGMRTAAEPLLALYCWRGDITVAARLTDGA